MRRLRPGWPRRALIVAPHSDDETIGAYGLMCLLRRRGCDVRVVIVTDGAGSHRASASWPPRRLVAERRRETLRALRTTNIPADRVAFLGLPDGNLCHRHATAIVRAIRRIRGLGLIVGPATVDAHPDHHMTAAIVAAARLPGIRRLEYRVWGRSGFPGRMLPLGPLRDRKRAAIRRYRTQMGIIRDDPHGFAIAPHELHAFSRAAEIFAEGRQCGRLR